MFSAVPLLALLLFAQSLPLLASAQGRPAPPALAPSASPSFSPHYQILGNLQGNQLTQSDRPRSVPLADGFQYAATYYTAKDLQNAYNITGLLSKGYQGLGETIAIVDAYGDPTIYQDVASFDKQFGLPAASLTVIPVGPYAPENGITYGWDAETALDVEAAHAAAPLAHINLVIGANASNALYEAVKMVVDKHLGDVVSMSWGLGENSYGESGFSAAGFLNYAYIDYYFQKGAAEGITFLASSGDYGAFDGTTTVTADFPSTSPFVTGVGGTTLFMSGTAGAINGGNSSASYSGETAWSVSPQYVGAQGVSSGGGYSSIFAQPYYQAGAITSLARASPDVSADANPYTGFVIVLEGGDVAIGGTSLASPLWAGMVADMDQFAGKSLGLLNPYLYSVYSNRSQYDRAFHQVATGFNGEYQAGPGYNVVTGLGTPNLPALASAIKDQSRGLTVSVSTSAGSSASAPTQYTYGEEFTITAEISGAQGPVTSGAFSATINGPAGLVAQAPLSFDGTAWVGSYTVANSDPAGSWTVQVSGSGGGASGSGIADVSVGDSLAIVAPVPYPFGTTTPSNVPFTITAVADDPSGNPISNVRLSATLTYEGQTVADVNLASTGSGYYSGQVKINSSDPQGTYSLVVQGTGAGSVFGYLYVGEAVTGVLLTQLDTAVPSASPGDRVVLLAKTLTASNAGRFTSNATANFYSLAGNLMARVALHPAPNAAQFGVFNFFGYDQANFTIPNNFTQGFYKVQFLSSYKANSTAGAELGNFTTGFYVSGPSLSYTASTPPSVYEGQNVTVQAKITAPSGAPVDSGVFFATVVPSGYSYEAYITDALGYTGALMHYNATTGTWQGSFDVPSPLTSPNAFIGNLVGLSAGPWTVYVSGESANASIVTPSPAYVTVMPYIAYPYEVLNATSAASAPLVVDQGGSYILSGIASNLLSVNGINITLSGVSLGALVVDNATVRLVGSQVGTLHATGSKLSLLQGTQVGELSTASSSLTVQGSFYGSPASGPSATEYLLYAALAVSILALAAALLALRRRAPTSANPPHV